MSTRGYAVGASSETSTEHRFSASLTSMAVFSRFAGGGGVGSAAGINSPEFPDGSGK
jgi:hypothetical protein